MSNKKYITGLDIESTGLNQKEDRIVQISAIKCEKDTWRVIKKLDKYILPTGVWQMNPTAQATHGITREFLEKNGVALKPVAQQLIEMLEDSDVLTFNGNHFDINFIANEFAREGLEFPIEGRSFYDSYGMECRFTPRDLQSVYERYTNKQFENAHNSLFDVKATLVVFAKQMQEHKLSWEEVDAMDENQILTTDGSIRNAAAAGKPMMLVFSRGKYKDSDVLETLKKDPGYVRWFLEKVANEQTKKVILEYQKEYMARIAK